MDKMNGEREMKEGGKERSKVQSHSTNWHLKIVVVLNTFNMKVIFRNRWRSASQPVIRRIIYADLRIIISVILYISENQQKIKNFDTSFMFSISNSREIHSLLWM